MSTPSGTAALAKQSGAKAAFARLRAYFAFIVIGAAFVWSAITIVTTRVEESPPGTTTIRIAHWQLETGVKAAIDELAQDYQKLHPNVRIVQNVIPENVYPTWITTNLLGGTAPDLVQIPVYRVPDDVLVRHYNRYFVPLTTQVQRPNPYNIGTSLEGVPLRKTYKEGMSKSYIKELQEYMNIPLSLFSVRIFYNKDLYKKLVGSDTPPSDYREFLKVCEIIRSKDNPRGQKYIPICACNDSIWAWEKVMFEPLSYAGMRKADYNRDGFVTPDELFAGFKSGMVDFEFPPYKARYKIVNDITRNFPVGFTGLARDDAVFQFAQQRGVFFSSGTWDAMSLIEQAKGKFEVGVMEFPLPSRDDKDYGPFVEGPLYEEVEGGFPIGLTRTSKNQDVALDFMFFLAGQKQNEKLNRRMAWIPIIIGTEMDPFFKVFDPHLEGVYGTLNFRLGGETRSRYEQLYSLYQSGRLSYESFVSQYEPFFKSAGEKDFAERQRDLRRSAILNEQLLAGMRASAQFSKGDDNETKWIRYRAMIARQVLPEINNRRMVRLIEQGPAEGEVGPYEYSPAVLQAIRQRLKK